MLLTCVNIINFRNSFEYNGKVFKYWNFKKNLVPIDPESKILIPPSVLMTGSPLLLSWYTLPLLSTSPLSWTCHRMSLWTSVLYSHQLQLQQVRHFHNSSNRDISGGQIEVTRWSIGSNYTNLQNQNTKKLRKSIK